MMPGSLCRLTVACCTDDTHRAVDVELPADIDIGRLLPQIVDIVQPDAASMTGLDWRLSRLGQPPIDESETLNDNDVRDGDVLLLTTTEPSVAQWASCDPCHAMAADGTAAPAPRVLAAISCVLLCGLGAAVLVWPAAGVATTGRLVVATSLAIAAVAGTIAATRLHTDTGICVALSLIAVLYAGGVGVLTVRSGTAVSGLLLASAAVFAASILVLRVTGCGRIYLTATATLSALSVAAAAASVSWGLGLNGCGAMLVALSLSTLAFAPRLSMFLSGTAPDAAPAVRQCHQLLTGLVCGSSITAALGVGAVAVAEVRGAGSAPRDISFIAVVALVLLLRVRTHVDSTRRCALTAAAVLCAMAGLAYAAIATPAHVPVIGTLAAAMGAAALSCIVGPTVSPIALRAVEVVEYVALAAVIPMACWVGGIYGWAREVNLV
jgi:type VII secretion integral membrane protein EccD